VTLKQLILQIVEETYVLGTSWAEKVVFGMLPVPSPEVFGRFSMLYGVYKLTPYTGPWDW